MTRSLMLVEENPHATRVALVEDGRLAEVFLERPSERGLVGNVYKGRVNRVLPGMQAAFVDVGLERDAFLFVDDAGGPDGPRGEDEEGPEEAEPDREAEAPAPTIEELVRTGQELLVQVLKDPLPGKGARVTTRITLPGRYLVFAPGGHHRGVSRRIEDETERDRLRAVAEALELPGGVIVRTVGEGKPSEAFAADAAALQATWWRIEERAAGRRPPVLVHRELGLACRTVRDLFGPEVEGVWIDGDEAFARIVDLLATSEPGLLDRVHRWNEAEPLFSRHAVDEAIAEALRPKVWLQSGGYLVIQSTEALVAIDVNTGRYVGRHDLDSTILVTNLEAVREIVRQVRLRNLGGILVLDLIDMTDPAHREEVFAALERELLRDRARHRVLSISPFGLVEITRQRSRPSLERQLTRACPYCEGRGRILAVGATLLRLRREVLRRVAGEEGALLVRLHPEVAEALQREESALLEELEQVVGGGLVVQGDATLHREAFEVRPA